MRKACNNTKIFALDYLSSEHTDIATFRATEPDTFNQKAHSTQLKMHLEELMLQDHPLISFEDKIYKQKKQPLTRSLVNLVDNSWSKDSPLIENKIKTAEAIDINNNLVEEASGSAPDLRFTATSSDDSAIARDEVIIEHQASNTSPHTAFTDGNSSACDSQAAICAPFLQKLKEILQLKIDMLLSAKEALKEDLHKVDLESIASNVNRILLKTTNPDGRTPEKYLNKMSEIIKYLSKAPTSRESRFYYRILSWKKKPEETAETIIEQATQEQRIPLVSNEPTTHDCDGEKKISNKRKDLEIATSSDEDVPLSVLAKRYKKK